VTARRDQRSRVVFAAGIRLAHLRGCARRTVPAGGCARITIFVSGMYKGVRAARDVRRPTGALPAAT